MRPAAERLQRQHAAHLILCASQSRNRTASCLLDHHGDVDFLALRLKLTNNSCWEKHAVLGCDCSSACRTAASSWFLSMTTKRLLHMLSYRTHGPMEKKSHMMSLSLVLGRIKLATPKFASVEKQLLERKFRIFGWIPVASTRIQVLSSQKVSILCIGYQQAEVCYAYIEDWEPHLTWADLASILPMDDKQSYGMFQVTRTKTPYHDCEELGSAQSIPEESHIEEQVYDEPGDKSHETKSQPSAPQGDSSQAQRLPLRWFTRGWTLQELIAPKKIEFFDGERKSKGMKSDPLVVKHLSRITGIAVNVLSDTSDSVQAICYGQRMSWAAYRNTSRKEDIAYCLLGIFEINMALLYGEGAKSAFIRLQEAILMSSTDMSLLAWIKKGEDTQEWRGIFSHHPYEFQGLRQCRLDYSEFLSQDEVIMTNKGVRIETALFYLKDSDNDNKILPNVDIYFLSLGCYVDDDYLQGIFLKKRKELYVRGAPNGLLRIDSYMRRVKAQTIYLARDITASSSLDYERKTAAGIKVKLKAPEPYRLGVIESWPSGSFDALTNTFVVGGRIGFVGYLLIRVSNIKGTGTECNGSPIAKIMAVISKDDDSSVHVNVLDQEEAEKFKADIELISTMDSRTARMNLASRLAHLWQYLDPVVTVQDHASSSLLRVNGKVIDGEQVLRAEFGEAFQAKIVNINVDVRQDGDRFDTRSHMPVSGVRLQPIKGSILSRGLAKIGARRSKPL